MSDVLVLGLSGLGLLVALALAGVALTKRRVPLVAWVVLPMLVLGVGAIGTWLSAGAIYTEIETVRDGQVPAAATAGLWSALGADAAARWAAAALLAISAGLASLGAVAAGDDTRLTPITGVLAGLTTLLGVGYCSYYAMSTGITGESTYLIGVLLIGGLGVTIGSFRRALDEQAQRVAAMRFASAICMLLAISTAGRALVIGNEVATFGPGGLVTEAADLQAAVGAYAAVAAPVYTLGWIAFAFGIGIAFFGFFYELGDVVERPTVFDVWATLAIMALLGLVRVVEHARTDNLLAVATNWPAVAVYEKLGSDLAPSILSIEKAATEVHASDGGFGDVLVWKRLEGEDEPRWIRAYRWNGSTWYEDDTPLEDVQLHPRRPLLGIGSSEEAAAVLRILDKTPDGRALLLMRGSEVKGDVIVPSALAHRQVGFLELEKAGELDLQKQVWSPAGSRTLNWGPVAWFGEGEGGEPLAYAAKVAESTEAEILQVLVPDEKPRVKDIVNSCLPWIMKPEGKGAELSERRCYLSTGDVEETRAAASEIWPLPEGEHSKMFVKRLEGTQPDPAVVEDRFLRELGAIDYCVGVLKDEGEEARGPLRLEVEINKKGKVGDMIIHERSRVQSQPIARCVAMRFKDVQFQLEEEVVEDGKSPPPRPRYEVVLDLR